MSVVVPVFNGERYLRNALDSIEAQHYVGIEVVVVDDGSTDGTAQVVSDACIVDRAIRQPNAGPAAARNRGIEASTGELFAFLDADDLWPDHKLARQVDCMEREPALDVVLGRIKYVALDGAVLPAVAFEDPVEKTLSSVHLGSGVFRRRAFERVGLFDEELRFSEDHDWFLRARELGVNMRILPEVTLVYRVHHENMTRTSTTRDFDMTQVIKKSLDRRRAMHEPVELGRWLELERKAEE